MALIIRERTAEIRTISILYLGGASLGQDCGQNKWRWREEEVELKVVADGYCD
jgi:hypothetical protein